MRLVLPLVWLSLAACAQDRPWLIFERASTDFSATVYLCAADHSHCNEANAALFQAGDGSSRRVLGLQLAQTVTSLAVQVQLDTPRCDRLLLDVNAVGDEATVNLGDGSSRPLASCEPTACHWETECDAP